MRLKQNRFPVEFKNQIIKEVKEIGDATLVARKHDLVVGTVTRWVNPILTHLLCLTIDLASVTCIIIE